VAGEGRGWIGTRSGSKNPTGGLPARCPHGPTAPHPRRQPNGTPASASGRYTPATPARSCLLPASPRPPTTARGPGRPRRDVVFRIQLAARDHGLDTKLVEQGEQRFVDAVGPRLAGRLDEYRGVQPSLWPSAVVFVHCDVAQGVEGAPLHPP